MHAAIGSAVYGTPHMMSYAAPPAVAHCIIMRLTAASVAGCDTITRRSTYTGLTSPLLSLNAPNLTACFLNCCCLLFVCFLGAEGVCVCVCFFVCACWVVEARARAAGAAAKTHTRQNARLDLVELEHQLLDLRLRELALLLVRWGGGSGVGRAAGLV